MDDPPTSPLRVDGKLKHRARLIMSIKVDIGIHIGPEISGIHLNNSPLDS